MNTTKTIQFSHEYVKLYHQEHGILIAMFKTTKSKLSDMLLAYDTVYVEDGVKKYFDIPSGELIYLLFLGDFNIPFSTIRRYTPKKYKYYEACLRQKFILQRSQDRFDNSEMQDNQITPGGWRRPDEKETVPPVG